MNLAGLFDYFQRGGVFLLARDGVQYPRIFPIHSRINPFYSRNFTFKTKKLRTPYSTNFTFITQEITNTLLKKFYLYNPRNYEHLTQQILPLLPKKLRTPYSRNLTVHCDEYQLGFSIIYLIFWLLMRLKEFPLHDFL